MFDPFHAWHWENYCIQILVKTYQAVLHMPCFRLRTSNRHHWKVLVKRVPEIPKYVQNIFVGSMRISSRNQCWLQNRLPILAAAWCFMISSDFLFYESPSSFCWNYIFGPDRYSWSVQCVCAFQRNKADHNILCESFTVIFRHKNCERDVWTTLQMRAWNRIRRQYGYTKSSRKREGGVDE